MCQHFYFYSTLLYDNFMSYQVTTLLFYLITLNQNVLYIQNLYYNYLGSKNFQ